MAGKKTGRSRKKRQLGRKPPSASGKTMARKELEKRNVHLEKLVAEGSARLDRTRLLLRGETARRKKIEADLKKAAARLQAEKAAVEQKNIALRELLDQLETQKGRVRRETLAAVQRTLLPMVLRIKRDLPKKPAGKYVKALESNLRGLDSSFESGPVGPRSRLSPRELEVCELIKGGLSTKDIAQSLRLSGKTIERNRDNIRKKLKIKNRKINLVPFLQQI